MCIRAWVGVVLCKLIKCVWCALVDILEAVVPALINIECISVPCVVGNSKDRYLGSFCLLHWVCKNTGEACYACAENFALTHEHTNLVDIVYRPVKPHESFSSCQLIEPIECVLCNPTAYGVTCPHYLNLLWHTVHKLCEVILACPCIVVALRNKDKIVNVALLFAPCPHILAESVLDGNRAGSVVGKNTKLSYTYAVKLFKLSLDCFKSFVIV